MRYAVLCNNPFSIVLTGQTNWLGRFAAHGTCLALFYLMVGLLGACSSTESAGDQDYSRQKTEEVFGRAYAHIGERFIERLEVDTIALAGLSRLSVIDGRMQVTSRSGEIHLLKEGREVQRYPWPQDNNRDRWASLTAAIVDRAREVSPVSAAALAEDIYSTMMNGVVSILDQYSRYDSAKSANHQRESRDGFGGIGVTIRTDESGTFVVETLPETPAAAAGLQQGDRITHADGKSLEGMPPEDVAGQLRGIVGTYAVTDVLKAGQGPNVRLTIERVRIVPPTVRGRLEQGVAVLSINNFSRRTSAELEDEIERLEDQNEGPLLGLVLDLRNNPGGLLDQAVQVADLFLKNGPVITTRGRHPASNSAFAADSYEIAQKVPIAILINGRSASASEMLAAALQDRGRAVVIGSASHGKGSVQNLQETPNGGELVITWSRMYSPAGYVLDGLGILPNICTSVPFKYDAGAMLYYEQDRLLRQFQDWRRYDRVDLGLATTLRRACPASFDTPDSDVPLAAKVLLDPAIYGLALAPSVKAANMAEIQAENLHRS